MPSRRDLIRMTDDELADFVASQQSLQVATINPDGTPHLSTLWFGVLDTGEVVFATYTKSKKIRNLQRDERIACLLEDGTTYDQLRGAQINGKAELYSEPDTVARLARVIQAKNQPGLDEEQAEAAAASMARKRTAVVVRPESVVTWDHRKLGGTY